MPLLDGQAILEMKFRLAMPVVFKELVEGIRDLSATRFQVPAGDSGALRVPQGPAAGRMPDFLAAPFANTLNVTPWFVLVRLVVALAMGGRSPGFRSDRSRRRSRHEFSRRRWCCCARWWRW